MARPNVLWIVLDTVRADALEPYGASPGSSSTIADVARSGIALDQARVTACWTLPSHASMFTGALPRGLGLGQAPAKTPHSAGPVIRAEVERLLPEVMRRAGYSTSAVSTNGWVSPWSGFDTGFERFVMLDTSRQARLDGGRRQRVYWALEAMRGVADDGAAEAGGILAEWIDASPGEPFFWFVNVVECHSPYLPPRPYHGVSMLERLRAAEEARRHLNLGAIWKACTGGFDIPDSAIERMRRLYAAAVRYVDDWLGMLLTRLEDRRLLDDTLVILCSDHGENFGEGELITHAYSLDDRLLRVPFVVMGPGAETFDGMRSLAEFPTRVANAVGLESHPWHNGGLPAGLAVGQWDAPAPPSDPRIQKAVADWGLGQDTAERLGTDLTCVVSGRWKLQRRGAAEELYDLDFDPLELDPIRDPAAIADRAGDALGPLRAALDHPSVVASVDHQSPAASSEELEEIEDRMRLLGYM
jgi:arylsulfatase A-like enzyme